MKTKSALAQGQSKYRSATAQRPALGKFPPGATAAQHVVVAYRFGQSRAQVVISRIVHIYPDQQIAGSAMDQPAAGKQMLGHCAALFVELAPNIAPSSVRVVVLQTVSQAYNQSLYSLAKPSTGALGELWDGALALWHAGMVKDSAKFGALLGSMGSASGAHLHPRNPVTKQLGVTGQSVLGQNVATNVEMVFKRAQPPARLKVLALGLDHSKSSLVIQQQVVVGAPLPGRPAAPHVAQALEQDKCPVLLEMQLLAEERDLQTKRHVRI